MPKIRTESSTVRRHKLAEFIDAVGEVGPHPCSTCNKTKRVCKVHARSGKCSGCLRRGLRCDLKASGSQFNHLEKEREKIRKALQRAYEAQERAHRELHMAFATETRLRRQMQLIDERASEAITAELNDIDQTEGMEHRPLESLHVPHTTWDSSSSATTFTSNTWDGSECVPIELWNSFNAFDPVGHPVAPAQAQISPVGWKVEG